MVKEANCSHIRGKNTFPAILVLALIAVYVFYNPQTKRIDFNNPDISLNKYIDKNYVQKTAKPTNATGTTTSQ